MNKSKKQSSSLRKYQRFLDKTPFHLNLYWQLFFCHESHIIEILSFIVRLESCQGLNPVPMARWPLNIWIFALTNFYEILCDQWPVIGALTESKCGERLYGPVWAKCINTIFPSGSKPLEDKWNKISTSPSIFSLFYLFPTWDLSIVAHIIVLTTSFRKYIFSFTFRLDFNGWTDFFKN